MEEYGMYGGFASVYDRFMDNIPYDDWFGYLHRLLLQYHVEDGMVADLACGTGEITRRLSEAGYQAVGIDISPDMLCVAREKCGADVLLLCQDMRELELHQEAEAVVCLCDGMNYLCSEDELRQVFGRVFSCLAPGGVFIFDMKTEYFYREILGSCTIAENREDCSFIWENEYHAEERLNEYYLTLYELADQRRGLFRRTQEIHRQKAYPASWVAGLMGHAGFRDVRMWEAFGEQEPDESSERVYFAGQKK